MAVKYPGLITIDASVIPVNDRAKLQAPILARMASEGIYEPGVDAEPNNAAQIAFAEELMERSLRSLVQGYNKRQRIEAAQVDDPADEL